MVVFERDATSQPYIFHVLMQAAPEPDCEINLNVLKPLIDKCDPRLRIFIDMIECKEKVVKVMDRE